MDFKLTSIPVAIVIFLINTASLIGQDIFLPPKNKKIIKALAINSVMNVDGILDEKEWSLAQSASDFIQIEPNQGKPSEFITEVKIMSNDQYLYIGVQCKDPNGDKTLYAPDLNRDFTWRNFDTFAVTIDGFNDERNSATFVTNPYGVQYDYLSFDDIFFDENWNGLWRVRTHRNNSGWTAEFEIPWKTLRYSKNESSDRSWGINFLRLRRHSNELSAWSAYPRSVGFNRMEYAGKLENIHPPKPSPNIQVNPYTLSHWNKKIGDANFASQLKGGGDLKWAINANSTLDVTINPDFAQANVDRQINNLERNLVLYPEQRQFFLENASLFSSGLKGDFIGGPISFYPFFSRKIGIGQFGEVVNVDWGTRFVSRSSNRNIGLMAIQQASSSKSPGARFGVARYVENISQKFRLGAIAGLKHTKSSDSLMAYNNYITGADGLIRLSQKASFNFQVVRSHNSNTNQSGFAGFAQYFYKDNLLNGWITSALITPDYDNEIGFTSRHNILALTPGVVANIRGRGKLFNKYIRSIDPSITGQLYYHNSSMTLTEASFFVMPIWLKLHSNAFFAYYTKYFFQDLRESFQPLNINILPGEYHYTRHYFEIGTDQSKKFSTLLKYENGDFYNGRLSSWDAIAAYSPLPNISLKGSWISNNFTEFKNQDNQKVTLYSIGGSISLNPRLQFSGIYQNNSFNNLKAYNLRLAWEYAPLSYLYLVFNSKEYFDTEKFGEENGIIKVNFLKQF